MRSIATGTTAAAATLAVAVALILAWRQRKINETVRPRGHRSQLANHHTQKNAIGVIAQDTQKCFVGPLTAKTVVKHQHHTQVDVHISEKQRYGPFTFHCRRRVDFEELTGCRFTPSLVFEHESELRSVGTWAMPPPCSPTMPFGSIPSAVAAGCASQLSSQSWPVLDLVDVKEAPGAGFGLFARKVIAPETALCEYTGLVRVDPPQDELEADDYAYAFPVCDPNVVISATQMGGVARLLNHGDRPNCELRTVHLDGFLHVVCFSLRRIEPSEQCLIHYGEPYWRNARRRQKRVQL